MIYRAFFDRQPGTIEGFFTIQDEHGKPVFKRLQARSGQNGHTNTDWVRGKSPIPYGNHYLWIGYPVGVGTRAGKTGIGEFYPISNMAGDRDLIQGPAPQILRRSIGLHAENAYRGSAGCIVLVDVEQAYAEVFPWLRKIAGGQRYMDIVVCGKV
jgi:hypothetical protein